jgi:hypothetical protein
VHCDACGFCTMVAGNQLLLHRAPYQLHLHFMGHLGRQQSIMPKNCTALTHLQSEVIMHGPQPPIL